MLFPTLERCILAKPIELTNQVFLSKNIVAAEVLPTWIKLYPVGYGSAILFDVKKDMEGIVNVLKLHGFVSLGELMINPDRFVFVDKAGMVWKLYMDGYDTYFPLRGQQLAACDDWLHSITADAPITEQAVEPEKKPRKKKSEAA